MNEHENPPPYVGGYRVHGSDARPELEVEAPYEPLPKIREVLECASPLALWVPGEAGRFRAVREKRQRTDALQDAVAPDMPPRFTTPIQAQKRVQKKNLSLFTSAVTFKQRGFTLIELLVVITIIGILAAIGLPALRGLGGSTAIEAAKRQLLDDLALARSRAMNERTTVYVLFVPPGVSVTNLWNRQLTSYALYTRRGVGDQPGQGRPRQLTEWKRLPENIFIPIYKFESRFGNAADEYNRSFPTNSFGITNKIWKAEMILPYLAFNALGQLDTKRGDEVIPLSKGSIFYPPNGAIDPVETPTSNSMTNYFRYANNYIRINWLTGRARIEKREPL